MTHEDVMQMLAETEIPFAYDHFAEGESPDPPFICFLFPGSENFAADNVVYMEFSNLSIELYTDEKDPELEDRVEAVLNAYVRSAVPDDGIAEREVYYAEYK